MTAEQEQLQRMVEELEELEDIRAYDEAMVSGDDLIPFAQAIAEIEQGRGRPQ